MKIELARRVCGVLPALPGDKSISHRAAMLSALAEGTTTITNFSTGADCASTLACLRQLGVEITRDGTQVRVRGRGRDGLRAAATALDCGNSGSTMRMLAGLLATCAFTSELTGDDSLRGRPMRRIIAPLTALGVTVESSGEFAPLRVHGANSLQAITYETPIASAQVKSCVLLAGLGAHGRTTVRERGTLTRDHTERMLRWLGVSVATRTTQENGVTTYVHSLDGPARLTARDLSVPGDISSAAFFLAAAAMLPGSDVTLPQVGLNPTRAQLLATLEALGADIAVSDEHIEGGEPVGTLRVRGNGTLVPKHSNANYLRGATVAAMIDELPMLAVLGTQVAGGLTIRDAQELRVKESDRIAATVANLRALGAEVEEYADGLCVKGPVRLQGAALPSFGDHRIAMAFGVAGLIATGTTEILNAECAGISFPEFFALLDGLAER